MKGYQAPDHSIHTLDYFLNQRQMPAEVFLEGYRERVNRATDPETGLISTEGDQFSIVHVPSWKLTEMVGTHWRNVVTATEFIVQQLIDNGNGQPSLIRQFAPDYMTGPAWLGFWFRLQNQPIYLIRNWVRVDDLDPSLQEGWRIAGEKRNLITLNIHPTAPLKMKPSETPAKKSKTGPLSLPGQLGFKF